MVNPFPYQRPLRPDALIDREQEVARLLRGCAAGVALRVDAPRRYGKTSLVLKAFAEAEAEGAVGVLVDLRGVLTLSDVVVRVGRAYAALRGPIRRWLTRQLQGIELDFNIGILGAGAGIRLAPRPVGEEAALFALLDLPNRIASQGVRRLLVCFDEFQDVLQVEAVDDKLRSAIQHHDEFVCYLFCGSEPRLMRLLFEDEQRAFWGQAEPVQLPPLPTAATLEYLDRRFRETGKDAGDVLARLVATAEGHPQRVMFLAHKLWAHTPPGGRADLATWQAALADALLQEEPALEALWRSFDAAAEQRVLRAIAVYEGRPYRTAVAAAVGVARGSVERVVTRLLDSYVIRRLDGSGQFGFVDPLFGLFVRDLAEQRLPELADADEGERAAEPDPGR